MQRPVLPFAYALFFLSGSIALVYQVAWVRACSLYFGATTLAISTVVALFMAGLAAGAAIAARFADRINRPLLYYGAVELALGLYGFVSLGLIRLFSEQFFSLSPAITEQFWAVTAIRFVAVLLLLCIPTLCMGASLPLLSRVAAQHSSHPEKTSSLLYSTNTLGAFLGCLICGFYLLPSLGLTQTVALTAGLNTALAILTIALALRVPVPIARPVNSSGTAAALAANGATSDPDVTATPLLPRLSLVVFLSGFAALVCEIAWTRVIVMVIGGSVYAFAMVLSIFLAGLGIGGVLASFLPLKSRFSGGKLLSGLLVLTALCVVGSSFLFQYLPGIFSELFADSTSGDSVEQAIFRYQAIIVSAVLLGPAMVMGTILPGAIKLELTQSAAPARSIGKLYAANTLGAIAGSLLCGFLLIPQLGIRESIVLAASLFFFGAVVLASSSNRRGLGSAALLSAIVLGSLWWLAPAWNAQLMTNGAESYYSAKETGATSYADYLREHEELLFYQDGLSATISVSMHKTKAKQRYLSTNGKVDGSSHFDMPTQRLLGHVPLMLHPNPKKVCVIGLGTGTTAGSAALYPVDQVRVVEIEHAVVEASRFFEPENHALHTNPKVQIQVTDGRFHIGLAKQAYDVIISEPSNPWLSGAADLFTFDFFMLARESLREGGIFGQWIHLYNLQPENFLVAVRSFQAAFPYVYLVVTIADTDVLLIGSKHPFQIDAPAIVKAMQRPEIAADLADRRVGITSAAELLARFWFAPPELSRLAHGTKLHTDDLPVLAYEAPKNLYSQTRDENTKLLVEQAAGVGHWLKFDGFDEEQKVRFLAELQSAYHEFAPPEARQLRGQSIP